jgi:hypothetical protein
MTRNDASRGVHLSAVSTDTASAPKCKTRKRHAGHDGRLYELEPIKGQKRAWNVLWVHICPSCKWETVSPTGAECHEHGCSLFKGSWTV